jgi:hypothetical protein
MVQTKNLIMPALVGGLLTGILTGVISIIPIISCCNIFCCFWVILGGALSAFLLSKKEKVELKDGAVVGALSGLIGGVVATLIYIIYDLILKSIFANMGFNTNSDGLNNLPGMEGFGPLLLAGVYIFTLILYTVTGVIFGAVGGIIAVKLLEKKSSEPPKPVEKKVDEKKEEKIVTASIQNADVNAIPKTGEPKLSDYKA